MTEGAEKLPSGTAGKIRQLIEVAREREAELGAVLREIEILINGGEGIGTLLKQAEAAFGLAWSTRYPGAYVWQYAKDRPHLKRLIGSLGIEELEARFGRYIRNGDPFFTSRRHPFGTFVATVNQHAGAGTAPAGGDEDLELTAPADCQHDPRCLTDTQHTQRKLRDVRGQ
jgi:hypothetical protein